MLPPRRPGVIPLGLSLILAAGGGVQAASPASQAAVTTTTRATAEPRRVTVTTDDRIEIHGDYLPSGTPDRPGGKAPVVILLHGYGQDRSSFAPLLPYLHDAGFVVLVIDLRGHGESTGLPEMNLPKGVADRDPKFFREMYRDVQAARLWLSRQADADVSRFVLVGASVGGSVALNYAALDRSVDGVVWLTPGTKHLGIDSVRDARKYGQRPLLLLAAEPQREAADALGELAPQAAVQVFPGRGGDPMALHGSRMLGQVPEVEQTITEFLLKAAGPPTTQPVCASVTGEVYHLPDSAAARRIKLENLRLFSSPAEAEARGLRASKSRSRK